MGSDRFCGSKVPVQKVAWKRNRRLRCLMGSEGLGSVPEVLTERCLGTGFQEPEVLRRFRAKVSDSYSVLRKYTVVLWKCTFCTLKVCSCTLKVYLLCFASILFYVESMLLCFGSIILYLESMLLFVESTFLQFESALLYVESILWKYVFVLWQYTFVLWK